MREYKASLLKYYITHTHTLEPPGTIRENSGRRGQSTLRCAKSGTCPVVLYVGVALLLHYWRTVLCGFTSNLPLR